MFFACIGHLLCPVAFGQHHHRTTETLEQINIRVHPSGGGGAETPRCHTFRRFCRAGIIHRVVFKIFRHRFAFVDQLFDFCVGNITGHNQRSPQVEAGFDRVFRQLFADVFHRLVKVDINGGFHAGRLFRKVFCRVLFQFFKENPVFGDFGFDVPVGTATDT